MPRREIRFMVANTTHRAATWKCWAERGNELYLACRELGGAVKTSFHESGNWHVGFQRPFLDKAAIAGEWPTRIADQWQRPQEQSPGVTLAARIITPWTSVSVPLASQGKPIASIPAPAEGKAIEVVLILTAPDALTTSWPGERAMGTKLVGSLVMDNGQTAWLVWLVIDAPQLPSQTFTRARYFHGRGRSDVRGTGVRGMFGSVGPDGSHVLYDAVLKE